MVKYKIDYRKESCCTLVSESVTLKKELIDPRNLYEQELKMTIDPRYHIFYGNLPHT